MITITQKEYDAATILSNALKKYNGKVSNKNLSIDTGNKSLQTKVEHSYKFLRENNRLQDLGFLNQSGENELLKKYIQCKNNLNSFLKLKEKHLESFVFTWGYLQFGSVEVFDKSFCDLLSKINISQIIEDVVYEKSYSKANVKEMFCFEDYEDKFLCYLFRSLLKENGGSEGYKDLLRLHIKRYKYNSFRRYFYSAEWFVLGMLKLGFSIDSIFNELENEEDINVGVLNDLYNVDRQKTMDFYNRKKETFSLYCFSKSEFDKSISSIDSVEIKDICTNKFITKRLKCGDNFAYIKKMVNKLSVENSYKVNKEMLEYCKENKMDYSSYEKEVIKYELKLNSVENKKTKKRL